MCGIVGGLSPDGIERESVEQALNLIRHRGPDDSGYFVNNQVAIGMRRLAIIDVANGRQPVKNEDGSIVAVFNGEIYNYRELMDDLISRGHQFRTASDTETLVHLYEECGADMCEQLRGMFAFAVWDNRKRRLVLGRDRFGKKPLYYHQTHGGGILFASELKALRVLMQSGGAACEINEQSIYDYLSIGSVPQPATIYRNVNALPAASWMVCENGGQKSGVYWHRDYSIKRRIRYSDALDETRSLVSDAVRVRLQSEVPLGVFLSGGLDSSVVAFEAAQHVGPGLKSFTVAMNDREFDESPIAVRTAQSLGIRNHVLKLEVSVLDELQRLIRQYDQPFADSSAIPSLAVSRMAKQHVTVVLNGDGADEIFGGYRRYSAARSSDAFGFVPKRLAGGLSRLLLSGSRGRLRSVRGFAGRFLRGLAMSSGARYLAWTTNLLFEADKQAVWRGPSLRPTEDWLESIIPRGLSGLDTQMATDVKVNLLSDLLVKMDIATMAASVEARSPLLDHHLSDFTTQLPNHYLVRGNVRKALLREAYAADLPREVIRGTKRGFEIPLRAWLQTDLREMVHDTLGARTARVRDYLEDSFVDSLLQASVLPDRSWEQVLYVILILELWLREFHGSGAAHSQMPAPCKAA